MKIHIHDEKEQGIEGCKSITYQKLEDLNLVIDNSCEYILANNIFDQFPADDFDSILKILIQKLRLNGTLVISGTDIKLLSKAIYNELIDNKEASKIIANKKSMDSAINVIEKLENKKLKIITTKILNHNYEIFCAR